LPSGNTQHSLPESTFSYPWTPEGRVLPDTLLSFSEYRRYTNLKFILIYLSSIVKLDVVLI